MAENYNQKVSLSAGSGSVEQEKRRQYDCHGEVVKL